jgi:hypothetical protein
MPEPEVIVEANQRVVAVGKTGSGKSFLMRFLVDQLHRVMVLDPKATIDPKIWRLEWANESKLRSLKKGKSERILVRAETLEEYSYWLQAAWDIGNIVIYIDELYALVEFGQSKPPKILSRIYTQGREKEVGVWGATQRPSWVPMFTLSESDWFFAFRTQLQDDRRRLAELMGEEVLQPIADKHGFWVYNTEWDSPYYVNQLQVDMPDNVETPDVKQVEKEKVA